MNFAKFFALAAERGIDQSQLQVTRSQTLQISLFRREIENFSVSDSQSVCAAGIVKGKYGSTLTQRLDASTFPFLVNGILFSASLNEKAETADIFPGSPKYKKRKMFNPALAAGPAEEKLTLIQCLEDAVYKADPRIAEVEVGYTERESETGFYNSFGLKLKERTNYFYVSLGVVMRENGVTKNYYDSFLGNDLYDFNPDELMNRVVKGAASKFGAASMPTGKYPTVIDRDVMASLVDYFLSSAIADEVQRHSSMLEGKLNTRIASSKLTIEEKPLANNIFFSSFDGEGVAAQNKVIVKNGVLLRYFYNRETAKKDGVETTGNGTWSGGKIGTGYTNVFVKPGKQSFDEMISTIKDGVYITEVMGLGTGMNSVSGDFSCQAEGFRIRDGKIAEPLTLITLSGNLLRMFKDLRCFASDVKLTTSAYSIASAYIRSMNVGGE